MRISTFFIVVTASILTCEPVVARDVYTYELIEGRNSIAFHETPHEAYGELSGRFKFAIEENGAIEMLSFDLRFTTALVDPWANVEPLSVTVRDNLSDFLLADFSNTNGIATVPVPLNPEMGMLHSLQGYIGPSVSGNNGSYFLGHDFIRLSSIGASEGIFELQSRGREGIGGEFRLFAPSNGVEPDENGFAPMIAFIQPNVRLVPEPPAYILGLIALIPLGFLGQVGRLRCRGTTD